MGCRQRDLGLHLYDGSAAEKAGDEHMRPYKGMPQEKAVVRIGRNQ